MIVDAVHQAIDQGDTTAYRAIMTAFALQPEHRANAQQIWNDRTSPEMHRTAKKLRVGIDTLKRHRRDVGRIVRSRCGFQMPDVPGETFEGMRIVG